MNNRLAKISNLVQTEAPGLSAEAFSIYMLVAREHTMSLKRLSSELEVSQAEVMRAVAELSAWELEGQRGAGLLRIKESDLLKKEVLLSDRGQQLKKKIERVIHGQH
ncbi:MAG: hypothetical protein V3R20_04055 [Sphingomonadales bacterium]